jgi:hypothetical protein
VKVRLNKVPHGAFDGYFVLRASWVIGKKQFSFVSRVFKPGGAWEELARIEAEQWIAHSERHPEICRANI